MSSEHIKASHRCWICKSPDTIPFRSGSAMRVLRADQLNITDRNYGVTLALRRCARCGFIFADADDLDGLPLLYAQMDDADYVSTAHTRLLQMRCLLRQIRRACPDARTLLDVGAGIGILLAVAVEEGMDAIGVEPSRPLGDQTLAQVAGRVLTGQLPHPQLNNRRFDLVTLIDVIEHVPDPIALLRQCADQLSSDGMLVVVTPDVESIAARILTRRWWHYRLAHVGYFSKDTLRLAAEAAGLREIHSSRPRWYLPLGYLVKRLEIYAPCWLRALFPRFTPQSRSLADFPIPLNLHDSLLVFFRLSSRMVCDD